jgi:hypothetical protein
MGDKVTGSINQISESISHAVHTYSLPIIQPASRGYKIREQGH